jgi:hypothetical protein
MNLAAATNTGLAKSRNEYDHNRIFTSIINIATTANNYNGTMS